MTCSVTVVYSKKRFLLALRQAKREKRAPYFFEFGDIPTVLQEIVKIHDCKAITPHIWSNDERDVFLRAYRDLIGELNIYFYSQQKIEWQMTDIASKNRFTSPIPYVLEWYLQIQKLFENKHPEFIIIIAPPWTIIPAIRKLASTGECSFFCNEFLWTKWTDIINERFHWYRDLLIDVIKLCRDKWYSRALQPIVRQMRIQREKQWYVIKTFIYNHSFFQDGTYRDIFFGPLPSYLEKKGQHIITFARILGDYRGCIKKMRDARQYILPLESFLSFFSLIASVFQLLFISLKFPIQLLFYGTDVASIIRNELLRTRNGVVLAPLLHYHATKKLASYFSVESFLMTYEGNPWERMCIRAVRQKAPLAHIMGYQHTVVHQSAINIFLSARELNILFLPDRILTVGEEPKRIMEEYSEYPRNYIVSACGLRFERLYANDTSTLPQQYFRFRLLAVLEGTLETLSFLSFLFREALRLPDYAIHIRPHPALPLKALSIYTPILMKNIPENVSFSFGSLESDLAWCDVVLYSASTVALEALLLGKLLIHVRKESVLDANPLFRLPAVVETVLECDHMKQAIQRIREIPPEEFESRIRVARAYLESYISPITDERLSYFLPPTSK